MSLTRTILQYLPRLTLINVAQDLRVGVGSNDEKADIIKELMSRRRTRLPAILEKLPKPELRKICLYLRLPTSGMPRADLIYRILDCPEKNWENPMTPREMAALEKKPRRRRRISRPIFSKDHSRDERSLDKRFVSHWNKSTGAKMRAHRKALGYSQKDLARMLGVKQSTISIWENAYSSPSQAMQKRIEYRLKMDSDTLPTRADEQSVVRWITSRRLQLNLSQKDLAQKIGVATSVVSQWETGQTKPSKTTLKRVFEVLGHTADGETILEPEASVKTLLLTARRRLGLTQKDFADKLKVSQAAISVWEKGRSEPRPRTKKLLLKTLARISKDISGERENENLSNWIAGHRRMHGMTQKELAKALRTSHSTISLWENGKVQPSPQTLKKLYSFFGERWQGQKTNKIDLAEAAHNQKASVRASSRKAADTRRRSAKKKATKTRAFQGQKKKPSETNNAKKESSTPKATKGRSIKKKSKKPAPQSARIAEIMRQAAINGNNVADEDNADSPAQKNKTKQEAKKLRDGEKKVHRSVIRRQRPSNSTSSINHNND